MPRFFSPTPLIAAGAALLGAPSLFPTARAQDLPPASAQPCTLELSTDGSVDWRGLYGRGYEVFSEGESFETIMVEIRHSGRACRFYLTGSGTKTLTGGGDQLAFDLLDQPNGRSILSPDYLGTPSSQIEGAFGDGTGVQTSPIQLSIPSGQFVRGGLYRGQVLLRLFRQDDAMPVLAAETPLAIISPVASAMRIRSDIFAGGAHESSIDLGSLSDGVDRRVDFEIQTNASIDVTVESAHRGKLAHPYGAPGIAYELSLDGQRLSLDAPSTLRLNPAASRGDFDTELAIRVAPQPNAAAGRYSDSLTLTFTAN